MACLIAPPAGAIESADPLAPWLRERHRAAAEVARELEPGPAMLQAWLVDARRPVRELAAVLLGSEPVSGCGTALRAALAVESDPRVSERLLAALSRNPDQVAEVVLAAERSGDPRRLAEAARLREAVAMDALQAKLRDGDVPGFYDGQWAKLWPIDPRMPEQLIALSHDESLHFVLREVAVMALHETRRPELERELSRLLFPEDRELYGLIDGWPRFDPAPGELWKELSLELSRYVRFSLAKSGSTAAIRRMIERMEAHLATPSARRDIDWRGGRESGRPFWDAELLRGLLFEVGYYYQQFDDYESAELCYREVLGRFAESRACQNCHYNLACISSLQGKRRQALDHLKKAILRGFDDARWLQEDGDFASLREDPEFRALVDLAAEGVVDDSGTDWNRLIRRFLPAGCESLFDLGQAAQRQVWFAARSELSPSERRRMVEDAPPEQRVFLAELIESR
jgi:tetratricopeptide (TPR) repeat protein